ncbi:MAG: pyridoxal phosphate-dependent aminotransferase [Phototrophicales bacterium]|nr:MAG: aminotransferase [Phototrophicales bacterium]RMG73219.1 MAG: aminotransferase class I/II-fold pyridoxal phosphate-dependent enzyme [Chloroflexota bacterium]
MPQIANRVAGFGTTIFTEINELAAKHQAINLGQGKPDFDGPAEVIDAFRAALSNGKHNQYAPGPGVFALRQGVADHAGRNYGLEVDPNGGVIITPGATEAIFAAVMGLTDPGDEVIVIEPFFDSYVPDILMAGGKPVYVPLHAPDWTFDPDELRAAFNSNTRAIILNTPHNPTGRVFTQAELQMIAELCLEFDVTVISDEVYEHLIFDEAEHVPIATLPDMFERTITIGSAGKSFGMTGWKVGWAYGHPDLMKGVAQAHQFVAFAVNHPAQMAVAHAFTLPKSYYDDYRAVYTRKRDLMMDAIQAAGMTAPTPKGTYFVMADFSPVFDGDDVEFARYMTAEIGVAVIPPTFFYSAEHKYLGSRHTRFAFCKGDDTILAAAERMRKLKG